jgi:hypothetical protein
MEKRERDKCGRGGAMVCIDSYRATKRTRRRKAFSASPTALKCETRWSHFIHAEQTSPCLSRSVLGP